MIIRKLKKLYRFIQSQLALFDVSEDIKKLPNASGRLKRVRLEIAAHIFNKTDGYVFSGPLSTLRIIPASNLSRSPAILVGCYEQEIHPILNRIIAQPPSVVIDIGTSLGYYIAGLATAMPSTRLIGFETIDEYRAQAAELVRYNNVEHQITLHGHCRVPELNAVLEKGAFILCDCEGGEVELLDPEQVPGLKYATILCEVHDFFVPGAGGLLVERFKNSHHIEWIDEQGRDPWDYRILHGFPEEMVRYAIGETRHVAGGRTTALRFMFLEPKK